MMDDIPVLDVEEILAVVVVGGNVLAERQGARKRRRRVPRKQEQLIRLVSENGRVGIQSLMEGFSREWKTILKKRKGEYVLVPKQEFFRNMADLAGRVNAALLAAYSRPDLSERCFSSPSPVYLGLEFDQQRFEVWWTVAADLDDLAESLAQVDGSQHVRYTSRPEPEAGDLSAKAPEPDPQTEAPDIQDTPAEDDTIIDAEFVDVDEEDPSLPALPSGQPSEPESNPVNEIVVRENPVTGVWTFEVEGHGVEVEPRRSYVRIDGELFSVPAMPSLKVVEDLDGAALEMIREVIRLRASQKEIAIALGQSR